MAKGTYSNIQFDSFAIPEFKIEESPPTASGVRTMAGCRKVLDIIHHCCLVSFDDAYRPFMITHRFIKVFSTPSSIELPLCQQL